MAISIANLNLSTDNFASLVTRVNQIAFQVSTVVVTTAANTLGGQTSGNAYVDGILGSNTFFATTALRGGTMTASANLAISSNAVFNGTTSVFNSNVSIVAVNTSITSNVTTIGGNNFNVSSKTAFTGANTSITGTNFAVTSNSVIGGTNLTVTSNGGFSGSVTFSGANTNVTTGTFTVSAPTVHTGAVVVANTTTFNGAILANAALTVNALATFTANIEAGASLFVTTALRGGNTGGSANLAITSNAIFTGATVVVGSNTTINGTNFTVTSNGAYSGSITFSGTNTYISTGTLTVAAPSVFSGAASYTANIAISGVNTAITSNVTTISGNTFNVSSLTTFSGTNTAINGTNLLVGANTALTGTATLANTLTVAGLSTFNNDVQIGTGSQVRTAASTTAAASIRVPHGTAPTTPANGDIWSTTSGLFARVSSATKTVAFTDSSITGSAASLTTGRKINIAGAVTGNATFDGTADITITTALAAVATANNADYFGGQLPAYYRDASNLNAGTVPSGRLTGTYGISVTGTSASWGTGRKINLGGDCTGNTTIDGSGDVTLNVTVVSTTSVANIAVSYATVTTNNLIVNSTSSFAGNTFPLANGVSLGLAAARWAITGTTLDLSSTLTVAGTTTLTGAVNLNPSGGVVNASAGFLLLNSAASGAPTANAGLVIHRGSSANAALFFDETNDTWIHKVGATERAFVLNDGGAYSWNINIAGLAATATAAVTALTANNSTNFNGQAASYYLDAGNLTGTVAAARLSGNYTINIAGSATTANVAAVAVLANTANLATTALTANNSTNFNGQAAAFYANASNLTTGLVSNTLLTGTYPITITGAANNAAYLGGQLPAYYSNAANLTGTVAAARLSGDYTINIAGSATTANSATTALTANNSTNFNGQAAAYYANASNLTSGTVADGRLPATMSAKTFSGAITAQGLITGYTGAFSNGILTVSRAADAAVEARVTLLSGAAVDSRGWHLWAHSDGRFLIGPCDDALTAPIWSMTMERDGRITFANTIIGTANNATNLNGQAASYYLSASNINAGTLANTYLSGTYGISITGTANNSTYLNGQLAAYYLSASNINAGTLANTYLSGTYGISITGSAATATSATSATTALTANNSTNFNGQAAAFYANASNLTSGTVADGRLPATMSSKTFSAAIDVQGAVTAYTSTLSNGALTISRTASAGTNTTILLLSGGTTNSRGWLLNANSGGELRLDAVVDAGTSPTNAFTVARTGVVTFASTIVGTANNATNLNAQAASYYLDLTNATGTLASARLSGTYGITITGSANNSTNLNGQAASYYNDATNLTGTIASARLSGVYSTMTANNANNFNGQAASFYANATNLTSGVLPDARLSGVYTTMTANNANNFGGQLPSYYTNAGNLSSGTILAARLTGSYAISVTGTANSATYLNGQPDTFYANATNLTSGTLPSGRLTGSYAISVTGTANSATYLNGQADTYYTNIAARQGYTSANKAGDTFTGAVIISNTLAAGNTTISGFLNTGNTAVTGSLTVTGDITAFYSSDRRLKTNIIKLDSKKALDTVNKLNGYEFDRVDTGNHELGVIAQEVQEELPGTGLVLERQGGMLAVDYTKMVPVLLEAIKELSNTNRELLARIEVLEAK